MREDSRDILLARPYFHRIWYGVRLGNRGQRALLIVYTVPSKEYQGMEFELHVSRFSEFLEVDLEELKNWLPQKSIQTDRVRYWGGSSPDERQNALGLTGSFQSVEEVDKFLNGLRNSKVREQAQE